MAQGDVVLATTTSVRDAGLLDTLLPVFTRRTGVAVRVVAVGSGQAMALARRGEADILILHDPPRERRLVEDGIARQRAPLMENAFLLVGPPGDPAAVRDLPVTEAFLRLAAARMPFVSRGDGSGTHATEQRVWQAAGIAPAGTWYLESGQGMGATLVIADQLGAYTLTDDGTWLASADRLGLVALSGGDTLLANPYHVALVDPARFSLVNGEGARRLHAWLTGPEAQALIGAFGRARFGRPLFRPTAGPRP